MGGGKFGIFSVDDNDIVDYVVVVSDMFLWWYYGVGFEVSLNFCVGLLCVIVFSCYYEEWEGLRVKGRVMWLGLG